MPRETGSAPIPSNHSQANRHRRRIERHLQLGLFTPRAEAGPPCCSNAPNRQTPNRQTVPKSDRMERSVDHGFHGLGRRSWMLVGLLVGMAVAIGCTPAKETASPTNKTGSSDAPPLKLVLVDADSIEPELMLRWQTVSEQGLQITKLRMDEFETLEPNTVDALVYPADFIGTLVDRGWIATLPLQVLKKTGGEITGDSEAEASKNGLSNATAAPLLAWPSRLRSLSMFGGKHYAVPLGAPCWMAILHGVDHAPLSRLHQAILSNQNSSETATQLWQSFLETREKQLGTTLDQHRMTLEKTLRQLSAAEKRFLVDRYLWMMSTTESRYRGLFDLFTLQCRLNQPEFSRSARFLQRLALIEPTTIAAEPSLAWESVAEGNAAFAIGWPRTDGQQRNTTEQSMGKRSILPLAWNGANGLVVSLGRRTRQSANASDLINWLAADEQRSAMQALTPRVEPLEVDLDRNLIREDYREYQTTQRLEASNLSMELTPRFLHANRFLDLLGDALVDILLDPNRAESRLLDCKKQWDLLSESIGKEKLRTSLESASGYSK